MEKQVVSAVSDVRAAYSAPQLTRWGSVADLTLVGQTYAGDDNIPGDNGKGKENGSVFPHG